MKTYMGMAGGSGHEQAQWLLQSTFQDDLETRQDLGDIVEVSAKSFGRLRPFYVAQWAGYECDSFARGDFTLRPRTWGKCLNAGTKRHALSSCRVGPVLTFDRGSAFPLL